MVGKEKSIDENQSRCLRSALYGECRARLSRFTTEFMDDERANLLIFEQMFEIFDGLDEAVTQGGLRRPAEEIIGFGNVRATLPRIILRARSMHDARAGSGELDHQLCQFENGKFFRIADIDRSSHVIRAVHQANEAIDQIIDVTKRARLQSVAKDRDVAAEQVPAR